MAIARALVTDPAILLADEPTGNLDSATGADIMRLLLDLCREGRTILIVTHDAQIAGYAQRILHMRDGQITPKRELMSPLNTLLTALRGAAANKLRAVLTTLGIIIGVASVITMLALGNGARAAVEARFRSLGADQVEIGTMMAFDDGKFVACRQNPVLPGRPEHAGGVPLVKKVDMSVSGSGKVRYERATLDLSIRE